MSRYTTELRYILQNDEWTDERLGLGDYPIFSENYRETLNAKIKNWFYFDEIGSETPARFAHRMRSLMHNIMPYYNQLYNSCLEEVLPFLTMRYNVKSVNDLNEILNAVKNNQSNTSNVNVSNTSTVNTDNKNSIDNGYSVGHNTSDNTSTNEDSVIDTRHTASMGLDAGRKTDYGDSTSDNLSVTSDTPEGFVQTSTITNGSFANTATKQHDDTSTSNLNLDNRSYNHDDFGYDTSTSNTNGSSKVNGTDDKSTMDTRLEAGVFNGDSSNSVSGIVDAIIDEINQQIKGQSQTGESDYIGFNGRTMSEMLLEWRKTFLNIDLMILKELEILFIGVLN